MIATTTDPTLDALRGAMRFAVLHRHPRDVTIVTGSAPDPAQPQLRALTGRMVVGDGGRVTVRGEIALGAEWLRAALVTGWCDLTAEFDRALAHVRGGAR